MLFRLFLFCYVVLLVTHGVSLGWNSSVLASVATGFAVAIIAHTQYGILTIGLLLIHMMLEWLEHARQDLNFSLAFSVHAIFDALFLYQELKTHVKHPTMTFILIMCVVFTIYVQCKEVRIHHDNLIEPFVIGGMFGCTIFHLVKDARTTRRADR